MGVTTIVRKSEESDVELAHTENWHTPAYCVNCKRGHVGAMNFEQLYEHVVLCHLDAGDKVPEDIKQQLVKFCNNLKKRLKTRQTTVKQLLAISQANSAK